MEDWECSCKEGRIGGAGRIRGAQGTSKIRRHGLASHDDWRWDVYQREVLVDVGRCDVWPEDHVGILGEERSFALGIHAHVSHRF